MAMEKGDWSVESLAQMTLPHSQQHEVYSDSQRVFLSIAPKISSVLSILGCSWIVIEVWCFSNKRYYVYHKIVSAMALYCVLVSMWYFVSDWATVTANACRAQGYFVQLSLAPMLYFAMLFLYYTLVISYSIPEQRLTSNRALNLRCMRYRLNWHQIFHLIPFAAGVSTALISLPLDLFHPSPSSSWCWIAQPALAEADFDESFHKFLAFQWAFYLGPAWFAFLVLLALLFVVFQGVETQEKRMKKYVTASTIPRSPNEAVPEMNLTVGRNDSTSLCSASASTVQLDVIPVVAQNSPPATSTFIQNTTSSRESLRTSNIIDSLRKRIFPSQEYWEHRPRTRQVLVQCFCYVGAYFVSVIFLTVNEILVWMRFPTPVPYALAALQCIYQPLLGFSIFLAYRRPFYMRMRRQGLSRVLSLLRSCQWNQNPVDPPGQRGSLIHRQQRSRSMVKLSAEEMEQRKEWRRQEKKRRRKLIEERRQQGSRIQRIQTSVCQFLRSTSFCAGENMLETQGRSPKRTQSSPIPVCVPSKESRFDGHNEEDVVEKDWTGHLIDSNATSGNPASTKNENDISENFESYSTLGTRRTSVLTKEGSSRKFEAQDDDITGINERRPALLQDEDEQSISLADLAEEESSGNMNESEEDGEDDESGDIEAQRGIGSRIGLYMSFLRRGETKKDFDLIKQCSDTYKDLVFMDIFPEADGEMETKWRAIEARVSRYEKTKLDKYKLSMSVPVMSERHFGSNPRLLSTHDAETRVQPMTPEDKGHPRFAWAKNPLFKISGRHRGEVLSPNRWKNTSTMKSGSSEILKAAPKRTSSGGFFSITSKGLPDERFMVKLEKERSRQAVLQEISSRRIHSVQSAEGDDLLQMVDVGTIVDPHITSEMQRGRRPMDTALMSSNPLLDAGVDQDWASDGEDHIDVFDSQFFTAISTAVVGNPWAAQDVVNRATRRSIQSLEDIPETSEHSERGALRGKLTVVDKPPKRVPKRNSSGELSTRGDGLESSNEFTERSTGSSIRTIKRSNIQGSVEIRSPERRSHSSELTSDGVSMVSDSPMSDDGFLSESSDDNDETETEDSELDEHLRMPTIQSRLSHDWIRSSLDDVPRVSEQSTDDVTSLSLPVEGIEHAQDDEAECISDKSELTEYA
jgi:hypothetical protein